MSKFLFAVSRIAKFTNTFTVVVATAAGALSVGCGNPKTAMDGKPAAINPATNGLSKVMPLDITNQVSSGMQANPLESTNVLRAFLARGVIRDIPAGGQTVVVRHEEIPGFMPKMTMEFNLRDTNELRGLLAGDTITFQVKANQNESWIEGIQRASTNSPAAPAPSDPASAALLNIAKLKTGDVLPDAKLLSEQGNTLRFSDFRGSALAFTFIFTRCPLPDFCPRMNQHFSRARELLLQRRDAPTNWQFLSISFDPEFDKPGVLTRYAYSYRGQSTNRWLFAAAPTDVMASLVPQLDFRFANDGGSFIHNLRTVVIDAQGRLLQQFEGNKWKPADLADSIIQAARTSGSQ